MPIFIPRAVLDRTFEELRACGRGRVECQVAWISRWTDPDRIVRAIRSRHTATATAIDVDPAWITQVFLDLAKAGEGIRVQVHTHPGAAFHSGRDDALPLVHTRGFLSLVIPRFAKGAPDMDGCHLAELGDNGAWHESDGSILRIRD